MKRSAAMKVYQRWLSELRGWTLETRNGGHVVFVSPEGKKVFASASPSDHRALKNVRSDLRRASGRNLK